MAQVIEFAGNPHGRRYTPGEREAAYLLWRANRSIRKTAEALKMSPSTVGTWHQEDGWSTRVATEDADETRAMRQAVGALLVAEMAKNVETAKAIRDDPAAANRDRLDAVKWLSGVAGVAPVNRVVSSIVDERAEEPERAITAESLMGKSVDELMRLEQAYRSRRPA